jgi:hypothetical protein
MVKKDVKKESFSLGSGIIVEGLRLESESTSSEESKREEEEEQSRKARIFEAAQHSQSWKEAIGRNPKALGWCAYSLFTCVMWGYDGLASSVRVLVGFAFTFVFGWIILVERRVNVG